MHALKLNLFFLEVLYDVFVVILLSGIFNAILTITCYDILRKSIADNVPNMRAVAPDITEEDPNDLADLRLTHKSYGQIKICDVRDCTICLEPYIAESEVTILDCNHFFHTSCIFQWLKVHPSCPLCRKIPI